MNRAKLGVKASLWKAPLGIYLARYWSATAIAHCVQGVVAVGWTGWVRGGGGCREGADTLFVRSQVTARAPACFYVIPGKTGKHHYS